MKQPVNYIHHQNDFYICFLKKHRLHANHISLYHGLFRLWNLQKFTNPIQVRKEDIMRLCGIGSKSTYLKCLKDLHDFQYIIYEPSKVPYIPSSITILPLARNGTYPPGQKYTDTEPDSSPHTCSNIAPHSDPIVGRYIKKHLNSNKTERKTRDIQYPDIEEVKAFFLSIGQSHEEAARFFYHNKAVGWLLSGIQILDWKAAANKWLYNIPSIKPDINGKQSNTRTKQPPQDTKGKRYDNPL